MLLSFLLATKCIGMAACLRDGPPPLAVVRPVDAGLLSSLELCGLVVQPFGPAPLSRPCSLAREHARLSWLCRDGIFQRADTHRDNQEPTAGRIAGSAQGKRTAEGSAICCGSSKSIDLFVFGIKVEQPPGAGQHLSVPWQGAKGVKNSGEQGVVNLQPRGRHLSRLQTAFSKKWTWSAGIRSRLRPCRQSQGNRSQPCRHGRGSRSHHDLVNRTVSCAGPVGSFESQKSIATSGTACPSAKSV